MTKNILIQISVLLVSIWGRSATIEGFAPAFVGQEISLYTYSDYLTLTKVKIGSSQVNSIDSTFTIKFEVKQIIKAFFEVGNTEAELYLAPETDYKLYYKLRDNTPTSFAKQKASTFFVGLDTADINYKILRYENWFDEYIYLHQLDIARHGFSPYIDTFKIYAYQAYASEQNGYFNNFIRYHIANLERTKDHSKYMKSKMAFYEEYIEPFPIYPYNDQYMVFMKSLYSNDVNSFHTQVKAEIILAFDYASPSRLMKAMGKDPMFKKPELRELMMVNMLGNAYYLRQFNRSNIQVMLDSVSRYAKFQENGVAAKNMLSYLTKVEAGYPAPEISLIDQHGETVSWGKYKGKFIYISFFTTWSADAVNEMKLMEELHLKFGDYVEFVSFCTDKDTTAFKTFLKNNQNLTWSIVYVGDNHPMVKEFKVLSSPHYVLIDNEGFIALSPAKGPSPDGEYNTIERTFYFIKKEMLK